MVHFTCDLCGKDLTNSSDPRHVVKIESYPGFDPNEITEEDLSEDHMEAVSELLRREEGRPDGEATASLNKAFRFDLCPGCHAKFLKDPLGKEFLRTFDFSKN